jgi:hypothetical protein
MFKRNIGMGVVVSSLLWAAGPAEGQVKKAPVKIEAERTEKDNATAARVIYSSNALPNRSKGLRMNVLNLGFWQMDYALNEHVTVGAQFVPPFGVLGFGPVVRAAWSLTDKIHVGATAQMGGFTFLTHSGDSLFYYGGGPLLTIGDHRLSFNVAFLNYGVRIDGENHYGIFPTMGVSVATSKRTQFNVEAISMNTPEGNGSYGDVWAVLYSLRFFSDGGWFGEFGFIAPIFDGAGDLYDVAPLGIPLLGFGKAF